MELRTSEWSARARAFAAFVAIALLITTVSRILFFVSRIDLMTHTMSEAGAALLAGARLDLAALSWFAIPLALVTSLGPSPAKNRCLRGYAFTLLALLIAFELGSHFFFVYFDFRPNYLVLEHALDAELRSTVIAQYPLLRIAVISLVLGSLAYWLWLRLCEPRTRTRRGGGLPARIFLAILLTALCLLAYRGTLGSRRINPSLAAVSNDRVMNELSGSGLFNLVFEIDQRLAGHYGNPKELLPDLSREDALAEVRRHLSGDFIPNSRNPLRREIGRASAGPTNVVVVVMESFTAKLVGSLGGEPALSPEFDRLTKEGVLLRNCYATGERTIQGLEAVVASFPPLPGVSVVRRPETRRGFATLGSVLGSRGYETMFFYGGDASFDQMRGFFSGNGFHQIIEQRDFDGAKFVGKWGVSDQDLFERADREFRANHDRGTPFLAVLLTVSLHSPWEYPAGRIDPLPTDTAVPAGFELEELNNFRYADWAVGDFLARAREAPYFESTLFVFVADHGVHLRGRSLVPSEEYRVPALFLSPKWLPPGKVDRVTSQLDIAPTILAILGKLDTNPFFGSDVLGSPADPGFAPMIYRKRRYAVRSEDRLTVVDPHELAAYVKRGDDVVPVEPSTDHQLDGKRAAATVLLGDQLLREGRYVEF